MRTRHFSSLALAFSVVATASFVVGSELTWHQDYNMAYRQASRQERLLLVAFAPADPPFRLPEDAGPVLRECMLVHVATDRDGPAREQAERLLQATAFRPLRADGGLAVINLKYDGPQHGHVIRTLPRADALASATRVVQLIDYVHRKLGPEVRTDGFGLRWHTTYAAAYREADKLGKPLLIAVDSDTHRFTPDLALADQLRDVVLARLHIDECQRLLTHSGMRKFHGATGIGLLEQHGGGVRADADNSDRISATTTDTVAASSHPTRRQVTHVIPSRLITKQGVSTMLAMAVGESDNIAAPKWHDDYHQARQAAERERKMLLIAVDGEEEGQRYEPRRHSLPLLHGYVCLRQSARVEYPTRRGPVRRLFQFRDFQPLREQPGLVVYDFTDPDAEHYGDVVSAMPYKYLGPNPGNRVFSEAEREHAFLLLEPNTLTQRTLTWAIRVSKGHGGNQRLRSADGQPCDARMAGALRNSVLQCSYGCGHHAGGLSGGEIASPGPGDDIVDGALNMVRIWRGSPPHYGMMVRFHRRFGYDMHPSNSRHWYGTGRF